MAISLNGRYKLTTHTERMIVDLGGENPARTLTGREFGDAVANAFDRLAEDGQTELLGKIYLVARKIDPSLPSLEQLRRETESMMK